jgi:hypothetical protein
MATEEQRQGAFGFAQATLFRSFRMTEFYGCELQRPDARNLLLRRWGWVLEAAVGEGAESDAWGFCFRLDFGGAGFPEGVVGVELFSDAIEGGEVRAHEVVGSEVGIAVHRGGDVGGGTGDARGGDGNGVNDDGGDHEGAEGIGGIDGEPVVGAFLFGRLGEPVGERGPEELRLEVGGAEGHVFKRAEGSEEACVAEAESVEVNDGADAFAIELVEGLEPGVSAFALPGFEEDVSIGAGLALDGLVEEGKKSGATPVGKGTLADAFVLVVGDDNDGAGGLAGPDADEVGAGFALLIGDGLLAHALGATVGGSEVVAEALEAVGVGCGDGVHFHLESAARRSVEEEGLRLELRSIAGRIGWMRERGVGGDGSGIGRWDDGEGGRGCGCPVFGDRSDGGCGSGCCRSAGLGYLAGFRPRLTERAWAQKGCSDQGKKNGRRG